jgi:hypothetical protein
MPSLIITLGGTIAAVCSRCQSQHNYEFAMDRPSAGRILPKRNVGPNLIVIGRVFREDSPKVLGVEHLSFPKIQSGGIRAVRQNQRIIRSDVCDHPPACNVYSRSVQVTTPA